MKRFWMVVVLLAAGLVISFSPAIASDVNVFVSILPQKHFVTKIGGERVNVDVLVSPGSNPVAYEPSPRQMTALAKADVYFTIGVRFEDTWLEKIRSATPGLKIVSTREGIERKPIDRHEGHNGHGGHDHGSFDPHIWLSPPLVMLQARNILTGLIDIDPDHRQTYEQNYAAFINEIVSLDIKLRQRVKKGKEFMVFHPSWGYFADAYGLEQIAIEIEGKSPKAADLTRLIQLARDHDIRTVLVQPQFSTRDAEMIAKSIQGKTVVADPLAEDWADNLLQVADRIREN